MTYKPQLLLAFGLLIGAGSCVATGGGWCESSEDCGAGAECVENLCVASELSAVAFSTPDEVDLDQLVVLDASATVRKDGTSEGLVYEWTVIAPEGAKLESPSGNVKATVRASHPHETYVVSLVVNDQGRRSTAVQRKFTVRNSAPVVVLTADPETWPSMGTVLFDAASSSDPDGDELTFEWTLLEPAERQGSLVPHEGGKATLTTGKEAIQYNVQVSVADGHGATRTRNMSQRLTNAPPQINIRPVGTVEHQCENEICRAAFTLSAEVTDSDGNIEPDTVKWALVGMAPDLALTGTRQNGSLFSADVSIARDWNKQISGTYSFELSAADNDGTTSRKTVSVTVGNRSPTLWFVDEAGEPYGGPIPVAHSVSDGKYSASIVARVEADDPDKDKFWIEFAEMETDLPGATVTSGPGATNASAVFTIAVDTTAPTSLIDGSTPLYTLKAQAKDVNGGSKEATAQLLVLNRDPVVSGTVSNAIAPGHVYGKPFSGAANAFYQTFDFSNVKVADPDLDVLEPKWAFRGGPADTRFVWDSEETFNTLTVYSADPSLLGADLFATVSAEDAFGASVNKEFKLKMGNRAPEISATVTNTTSNGHVYGVLAGQPSPGFHQTFDISALTASDPDGDPLTVSWTFSGGTAEAKFIKDSETNFKKLTVFSTKPDIVGREVTATMTVTDAAGASTSRDVKLKLGNRAPTISGTVSNTTTSGHVYGALAGQPSPGFHQTFDISALAASDADGDPMTISWTFSGGTAETKFIKDSETNFKKLTVFSTKPDIVNREVTATMTVVDAASASAAREVKLKMGNRGPTISGLFFNSEKTTDRHTYGTTNGVGPGYFHTFDLGSTAFADLDGDVVTWEWTLAGAPADVKFFDEVVSGAPKRLTIFSTSPNLIQKKMKLRLTARDSVGATAFLEQDITIGNRPPVISATGLYLAENNSSNPVVTYTCAGAEDDVCTRYGQYGELGTCFTWFLPGIPPIMQTAPRTNVVWGHTYIGVPVPKSLQGAYLMPMQVSVSDPDGDPIAMRFSVVSKEGLYNYFMDENGNRLSEVYLECGAGGTTGEVTCNTSARYGFAPGSSHTFTQRDFAGEIKAVPDDGFDQGVSANRQIKRIRGQVTTVNYIPMCRMP